MWRTGVARLAVAGRSRHGRCILGTLCSSPRCLASGLVSQPPATLDPEYYQKLFKPAMRRGDLSFTRLRVDPTGKVLKLWMMPKYVYKEDIIDYFKGCSLTPEKIKFVYGQTFSLNHILVDYNGTREGFERLSHCERAQGRLGFRFLKKDLITKLADDYLNSALKNQFRGRMLVMVNVSPTVTLEDVEYFFRGYNYDPVNIQQLNISRMQGVDGMTTRMVVGDGPMSKNFVVVFSTEIEALRALREKKSDFCSNEPVMLRFIQ